MSRRNRASGKRSSRQPFPLIFGLVGVVALVAWQLVRSALEGPSGHFEPVTGAEVDASFPGLTDTRGQPFDAARHRAKLLLVTLGFTNCPDICPLTLAGVHLALESIGPQAAQVVPIFITVDPKRDTPEVLSAYVNAFDPRVIALTGNADAIARVATSYRIMQGQSVRPGDADSAPIEHTAAVLLIDQSRHVRATISTSQPADAIAREIEAAARAALTQSGAHVLAREGHVPAERVPASFFKLAQTNGITISRAWSRATPPGSTVGVAYLEIHNSGDADVLLDASSPVAQAAELHENRMETGNMQMRHLDRLAIGARSRVAFEPAGRHFMLVGLRQPLKQGERFVLSLRFQRAGIVQTTVVIAPLGATAPPRF